MFANTTDLDLRLIRIFLAVVDARGVTAAEGTLGLSQPTISTQLSMLETRVGFRLCERGRSGFKLTPKGERFVVLARNLVMATSNFVDQVRDMDRKLVGTLSIGLIGHAPPRQGERLADAIARFQTRDQAVRFSMHIAPPHELEEMLVGNRLDLALGYFWHRVPGLSYAPCFVEKQVACCGKPHPLFNRNVSITSDELATFNWVGRSYPLPEANRVDGDRPVTAIADNIEAATLLILAGGHLGYLPEHHAQPLARRQMLRIIDLQRLSFEVPFHIAIRRKLPTSPLVTAFVDDLLSVFV